MVIKSAPILDCEVKVCASPIVELHLVNISNKYEGQYKLDIPTDQTLCIIFSWADNNILELHTPR
jgi:hypothetical protein